MRLSNTLALILSMVAGLSGAAGWHHASAVQPINNPSLIVPNYIRNRSATITFVAAKITINNNGSIKIEGDFTIHDAEGKEFGLGGRTVISLCRCGMSENKPFCDGHHKNGPFESVCSARELPPPAPKPPVSLG